LATSFFIQFEQLTAEQPTENVNLLDHSGQPIFLADPPSTTSSLLGVEWRALYAAALTWQVKLQINFKLKFNLRKSI
jgi:hypothetical protein